MCKNYMEIGCITKVSELCQSLSFVGKRGKPQSPSQIACILTRPFYAGYILHRGNIYKGHHDTIVDVDTFNVVQKMIEERGGKFGKSKKLYFI